MKSNEFEKMQKEFSDLAKKFLDSGYGYQFVSDALGLTLLELGPHDNDQLRRLYLEATYAELAKLLGRDASAKLPPDRARPSLKEIRTK